MSFTADVKEELSHVDAVCSHCERATLSALVRIEGTLFISGPNKYRVEIATDSASVGRLMIRLLHNIYELETKLVARRSILHKTPNYLIEIPNQPKLFNALQDMGIITADGGLELGIPESVISKRCCSAAYLRGVFLGSGFISDPRSDFHLEMIVENEDLALGVVELMRKSEINAKILQRRNSYMVYLKSGNAILEFLACTGAHRCALILEEQRVVKSVRNDVNRITNAEIANQQKATSAAMDQIFLIRAILERYDIKSLPPALQEFIKLRVRYPDASLKELGEQAVPNISKSAMNHRLRRLEALLESADD